MQGLILFAHGARDARWAQPFERAAERLRALLAGPDDRASSSLPASTSGDEPASCGHPRMLGAEPACTPLVALAYLEFLAPDLDACAADLVARGCTRIEVLPVFLGAGGHVRKDLPARLEALRALYPQVVFTLHRAAGESAVLEEAVARWALGAVQPAPAAGPDSTSGAASAPEPGHTA